MRAVDDVRSGYRCCKCSNDLFRGSFLYVDFGLLLKVVDTDEHPRPVSAEKMAALRPVFKKDGVVTAANASGICDGAGR